MKIGIYNIFTGIWFLMMLTCGLTLSYVGFESLHKRSISTLVFGFFVLFTIGILAFLANRLQILIIYKERIRVIVPFLFRSTTIYFTDVKHLKWGHFVQKAAYFKTLQIVGKKHADILISDFVFENFNSLATHIAINTNNKIPDDIFIAQAKANNSFNYFVMSVVTALFCFIIYKEIADQGLHWVPMCMAFICMLVILATIRRLLAYRKWL